MKPNIKYFKVFGCTCYVLRDREHIGKFDPKSDEAIFLGYSSRSKAYRVFNRRTQTVEESINVVIVDIEKIHIDDDSDLPSSQMNIYNETKLSEDDPTEDEDEVLVVEPPKKNSLVYAYSSNDIIGDSTVGVKTRRQVENILSHLCFTSTVELRMVKEALDDPNLIMAM